MEINSKILEKHTVNGNLEQWIDKDGNRLNFNHSSKQVFLYLNKYNFKELFLGQIINRVFYAVDRDADHYLAKKESLCFNWKALTEIETSDDVGNKGLVGISVDFNPKANLIALRKTLSQHNWPNAHSYIPAMRKGLYFIAITDITEFDFYKEATSTSLINYKDYELQLSIFYKKFIRYKNQKEFDCLFNNALNSYKIKSNKIGKSYNLEDGLYDTCNAQ